MLSLQNMEPQSKWKKPPTEISAFALMLFAQFGAIITISTWFFPDELSEFGAATAVLVAGLIGIGFLQLFRVKNGRLLTYPLIVLLALSWVLMGEFEVGDAIFVVLFMSVLFSFLLYIPALAFDEFGLKMRHGRRKILLLLMLTIFVTLWFGLDALEFAASNEAEVWDEDLEEDVLTTLSSLEYGAAVGAAVLFVGGILGLLLTGGFGVELGPMKPEHAAFALALGNGLMGLFWILTEEFSLESILNMTAISGMMFLPIFGFFSRTSDETV